MSKAPRQLKYRFAGVYLKVTEYLVQWTFRTGAC